MRYLFVVLVGLLMFSGAYAQKIRLSEKNKSKYVTESGSPAAADSEMVVYSILRMELGDEKKPMKISFDRSSGELASKYTEFVFPELEKLTRTKFSAKAEIDILNYLSENGWEIFSIETIGENKIPMRKIYMRKSVNSE